MILSPRVGGKLGLVVLSWCVLLPYAERRKKEGEKREKEKGRKKGEKQKNEKISKPEFFRKKIKDNF
jgi:hypothetical protein